MTVDRFTSVTLSLVAICLILVLTVCLSIVLVPSQVSAETQTQAISADSPTQTHVIPEENTPDTAAEVVAEDVSVSPAVQTLVALNIAVTDRDGNPVSGASLTAEWDDEQATAQTASNGRAFIDVAEGSNVTISVDHETYIQNNPITVRDATEQEVSVEIAQRGTATVTVVEDGDPIQDARVQISEDGQPVESGSTDEQGQFVSGDIEQRSYRLRVAKDTYYVSRTDMQVGGNSTQTVQMRPGSVTLSVQVADDRGNDSVSVENAQVSVKNIGTVRTLGGGEASLSVPVNAWVDVEVTKDGYETVSRQKRVEEQPAEVEFQINRTPGLTVNPENTRVVSGERLSLSVVNEYDEPVEGATVRLDGELLGETDSDGKAVVNVGTTGEHEIVATEGARESPPVTVRGVADTTQTGQNDTTSEETPSGTDDTIPGFGVTALIAAVLTLAIVAARTG